MSHFPVTTIIQHDWTDGGATTLTMTSGATVTKGTTTIDKQYYRLIGNTCEMEVIYSQSGAGINSGVGNILFTLPGSMSFGTEWGALPSDAVQYKQCVGWGHAHITYGGTNYHYHLLAFPYGTTKFHIVTLASSSNITDGWASWVGTNNLYASNPFRFRIHMKFPVSI
jgi:hypothetical protein